MGQITSFKCAAGSTYTTYAVSTCYARDRDGSVTARCYMFSVPGENPLDQSVIGRRAEMFHAEWWDESKYGPLSEWRVACSTYVYMVSNPTH